jgi:uncharacterized protein YwqG
MTLKVWKEQGYLRVYPEKSAKKSTQRKGANINSSVSRQSVAADKHDDVKLKLPEELEPLRDRIEKSVKPYIQIKGKAGKTLPWESKFGGKPYWLKGEKYPRDYSGNALRLLAQINFEELPDIGLFPPKGILQFYLPADDEVYGLDFDDRTSQDFFRVVYIPDVVKDVSALKTDFRAVGSLEEGIFPVVQEAKLQFCVRHAPVSSWDYQFEKHIGMTSFDLYNEYTEDINSQSAELYAETFSGAGHKMGGYAHFTQEDPRADKTKGYEDFDVLLLQIDTDYELGIMWGDAGVANFFISSENLKNLDFSEVLYSWDCT